MIAIALMFLLPPLFLAAVCAYGLLEDRVNDRRLARRREIERMVAPYRPKATARLSQPGWGIAQWTPAGWALVPAGGAGR